MIVTIVVVFAIYYFAVALTSDKEEVRRDDEFHKQVYRLTEEHERQTRLR